MTTELEQKFYDTFGIEPKPEYWCKNFDKTGIANCNGILDAKNKCSKCEYGYIRNNFYPNITAEKLLEMICIILNDEGLLTINTEGNITDIKDFVLRFLIGKVNKNNPYCHYKTKNKIKHQIQQLFKEDKE